MKAIRCLGLFLVLLMCFVNTDVGTETIKNKKLTIRNQHVLDAYCAYAYVLDATYAQITGDVPGLHVKGWVHIPSGAEVTINYPSTNYKLLLLSVTLADGLPWKTTGSNLQTVKVRVPPDLREDSFKIVYEISNSLRIGAVQYTSVEEDYLAPKGFYQLQVSARDTVVVPIPGPKQISRRQVVDDASIGTPTADGPERTLPKPDPFNGNYERNGRDYAVLFATDIYMDEQVWHPLDHPVSDAEKIKEALEKYGFVDVKVHPDKTLQDIGNTLKMWENKIYDPDDQLLIYFAGHGHYDNLDGYLATTDSKGPDMDADYTSYYPYKRLQERLDAIPCPNILLIIDACHSGKINPDVQNRIREKSRSKTRSLKKAYRGSDRQRRIKETVNAKTRWYLTSGGNEEVPDDSVFTKAFLQALDATLLNKSGNGKVLTIEEIEATFHKLLAEEEEPYSPETGPFGDNQDDRGFLFIAPSFDE